MTLRFFEFVLEGTPVTMPENLTVNTRHQKFGSVETSRQKQDSLLSFGAEFPWWKWTFMDFQSILKHIGKLIA